MLAYFFQNFRSVSDRVHEPAPARPVLQVRVHRLRRSPPHDPRRLRHRPLQDWAGPSGHWKVPMLPLSHRSLVLLPRPDQRRVGVQHRLVLRDGLRVVEKVQEQQERSLVWTGN